MQPWHFVAIANGSVKREIRVAAEEEEREFYEHRAPAAWLEALAPLGTDSRKPFLEIAPWLIAIFAQPYSTLPDGSRMKHYYATESVGIATGLLLAAIHHAGLVALTHTPSPMTFLNRILGRPAHEKPFLLLVVGHPAVDAKVPDISRKPLDAISITDSPGCAIPRFSFKRPLASGIPGKPRHFSISRSNSGCSGARRNATKTRQLSV